MPIPQHCHNNDGCFYPSCKRCKLERAAPDLLTACEASVKAKSVGEMYAALELCKAAIAKAKE